MIKGLTHTEAAAALAEYGRNEVVDEKASWLVKVLAKFYSPIVLMLILAAVVSLLAGHQFDFYFILFLVVLNIGISIWHEHKADSAIAALTKELTISIDVLRDDKWRKLPSPELVPGDVVRIRMGAIVPADATVLEASHLRLNESALTGESLSQDKAVGDVVHAGTTVEAGLATVRITATGANTTFGKTLVTIEGTTKRSFLEEDIRSITKYLSVLALVAAVILSLFLLMQQESIFEILTLDLSIVIAGIPISLPTVMTLIISVGISRLAKEGIVTRKISSLENLANVNLLLTDKTGTLTEDKIKVVGLHPAGDLDEAKMLIYAEVANTNDEGGISTALAEEIAGRDITLPEHDIKDFIPHDSERKRSTAHGQYADQEMVFSLGAPQVVLDLCTLSEAEKERIEGEVENYAANGYRALALSFATGDKEEGMTFGGVILFSDTLRRDAAATIRFMRQHGVAVKMVTGDNHAIAARVAEELAMDGKVWSRGKHEIELAKLPRAEFTATAVFAEVLPAEKYELVEQAKKHYAVAVTGDGVNDIPPVRAADVGIAVKSAVDALKQAADIVINRSGLHVITKAILEARNIFARLTAYSVYRISESVRVIFSLLVLALLYTTLPIQPIQLILLALVNDIPIISLAFNRTEPSQLPSVLHSKQKFVLGSVFGALGLLSSILFVIIARSWLSLDWAVIQTLFFLKLSVSGHLLIYVAHTKHRWWKYLPSRPVIVATTLTQMFASLIAFFGFLMAPISLGLIGFVWLWSLLWMQVSELAKFLEPGLERELQRDVARARHDVRAVIH